MKYDLNIDLEDVDVYCLFEYRIITKNAQRIKIRLYLMTCLLKLVRFICPGKMLIKEDNKFDTDTAWRNFIETSNVGLRPKG